MTEKKEERDADLVKRYLKGESVKDLREAFQITTTRIYQILKRNGVPRERPSVLKRDQFLGVNLTEPVKDALRAEADRRGITISSLSSETLREMLLSCGYYLEAEELM